MMTSTQGKTEQSGGHPERPLLLTILAVLLALYGAQSLVGAALSLSTWPWAIARCVTGLAAGAAAWGIWIRRRWALAPYVVCVLDGLGTFVYIALFAANDLGLGVLWRSLILVALPGAVLAIFVGRYIWRNTERVL